MIGIKNHKIKTLYDLTLDNEYVLKLPKEIKDGQKIPDSRLKQKACRGEND